MASNNESLFRRELNLVLWGTNSVASSMHAYSYIHILFCRECRDSHNWKEQASVVKWMVNLIGAKFEPTKQVIKYVSTYDSLEVQECKWHSRFLVNH